VACATTKQKSGGALAVPSKNLNVSSERNLRSIVISRMAGIGASCPFRLVLANVPSPNPQQPFAAGDNLLGQAVRLIAAVSSPA